MISSKQLRVDPTCSSKYTIWEYLGTKVSTTDVDFEVAILKLVAQKWANLTRYISTFHSLYPAHYLFLQRPFSFSIPNQLTIERFKALNQTQSRYLTTVRIKIHATQIYIHIYDYRLINLLASEFSLKFQHTLYLKCEYHRNQNRWHYEINGILKRKRKGECAACLKYSVNIFVEQIFKMLRLEVSCAVRLIKICRQAPKG